MMMMVFDADLQIGAASNGDCANCPGFKTLPAHSINVTATTSSNAPATTWVKWRRVCTSRKTAVVIESKCACACACAFQTKRTKSRTLTPFSKKQPATATALEKCSANSSNANSSSSKLQAPISNNTNK